MDIYEFGQLVFALRIKKDKTVKEAGREMGVAYELIDRLERGDMHIFPRLKTLERICLYYKMRYKYVPEQFVFVKIEDEITDERIYRELEKQKEEEREELELKLLKETMQLSEGIMTLDGMEKVLVERALVKTDGNRTEAAKLLNIAERTLYRKMNKYGLKNKIKGYNFGRRTETVK